MKNLWRTEDVKQNVLEANNHSKTKMFPLGVVVREKLPDLTVPLHRQSICLLARVHSIREQPLHVKPSTLPVSLSPLLFQISSYLSQNLITMQKYEWDTAGSCVLSLTQRLYISNCNELLHFSKTLEEYEKDREQQQTIPRWVFKLWMMWAVFIVGTHFLIIVRLTALTRWSTLLNKRYFSLFHAFKVEVISYLRCHIWLKSNIIYDVCVV